MGGRMNLPGGTIVAVFWKAWPNSCRRTADPHFVRSGADIVRSGHDLDTKSRWGGV